MNVVQTYQLSTIRQQTMPCTIKIRLVEARDLPVMDRTSKLADAYVGITFASFEAKSSVSRKTLNPKWDEEFRFDVADDSVLQSQPIEFKLMDHDVYTTDAVSLFYVLYLLLRTRSLGDDICFFFFRRLGLSMSI
jgi:Ca2+-dependent lipid-binding protein